MCKGSRNTCVCNGVLRYVITTFSPNPSVFSRLSSWTFLTSVQTCFVVCSVVCFAVCSQMCCWLLNVDGWAFRFASWKALRAWDGFQNYLFVVLSLTKRRVLLFKQRCYASVPFSDSNIIKREAYTFVPNHERLLYKCWSSTDIEHFLSVKPYRNGILAFNTRMFLKVNTA